MKYLKKFEIIYWSPKYKIGDFVRIQEENYKLGDWQSKPYKIKKIGNDNDYLLDTVMGGYVWRKEKYLILVPEYEIVAKNYNL